MTLNVEELQKKHDSLKAEAIEYARGAQADINKLQQMLQTKVREAQRSIDNKEGQISGLDALINELKGTPGDAPVPTVLPAPENN